MKVSFTGQQVHVLESRKSSRLWVRHYFVKKTSHIWLVLLEWFVRWVAGSWQLLFFGYSFNVTYCLDFFFSYIDIIIRTNTTFLLSFTLSICFCISVYLSVNIYIYYYMQTHTHTHTHTHIYIYIYIYILSLRKNNETNHKGL